MKKLFFLLILIVAGFTASAQKCTFGGTWKTVWYVGNSTIECTLTIDHSLGSTYVSGRYTTPNGTSGSISGTSQIDITSQDDQKITISGTWSEHGAKGTFRLSRLCSKPVFEGSWSNANGAEGGGWFGELK